MYNAGEQIISVQEEAVLSVKGDVLNEGNIINTGSISVSSHWQNQGVYNGTGTLIMNGEGPQELDNNNQPIDRLTIDGGGEKQLTENLTITKELSLINGLLTPSEGRMLSLTNTATISDASANAYINGAFQYAGTGYKFFPVGKNGNYRPLELIDVTGIDPVLQVEVIEAGAQPRSTDDSLSSVSATRYWEVNTMAGTYSGSLAKLSVGSDEGFEDLMGAVVAEAADVGEAFVSLGQSETSGDINEGTVTSESLATQKILALGLTALYSIEKSILVPSAFAPDAANPKDQRLIVFGNNITEQDFSFRIFDRWGKQVYKTESFTAASIEGWDGISMATGEPAQFGVYSYVIQVRFDDGEMKKESGTITLFR